MTYFEWGDIVSEAVITDREVFVGGHKFSRLSTNDVYSTEGTVYVNWSNFVNGDTYSGFSGIVQTDLNIDTIDPKKTMVQLIAISQDYYLAREWAEIYTDEDGKNYYAILCMYNK